MQYILNATPLLASLLGIYVTSLYGYLLFHSLAEGFCIVIACGIFMIAWNARRLLQNHYVLFIGIAYLYVGGIDFLHTLAYEGMGVFEGFGANLATQLWIAGRYVEALSLLLGTIFLHRKLSPRGIFIAYGLSTGLLLASIFYWKVFPVCFTEGVGLTPFKIYSEYVICLILLAAIGLLIRNSQDFDRKVLILLVSAIGTTIAQELAFTAYLSVYGFSNMIGHLIKIASFYLVYKAIVETSLVSPWNLLFRNLKQSEARYRSLFDNMTEGFALHEILTDIQGRPVNYRFLEVNPAFEQLTGLKRTDLMGRCILEVLPGTEDSWIENYGRVALTGEPTHFENFSAALGRWYEVFAYQPAPLQFAVVFTDITGRKRIEESLRQVLTKAEEGDRMLSALMEYVPEGITMADKALNLVRVSRYGRELIGGPHEDMSTEDVAAQWKVFHADGVTPMAFEDLPLVRAVQRGEVVKDTEIFQVNARGERLPLLCTAGPIRDATGNVIGGIVVWRDITERKQMEEEIHRSRDELEIKVKERTAELEQTSERLKEENQERIRTEQSLRLEEARLDALLHLGQISEAPLKEITGFTLEQAIGLTHSKIGFVGFLNEDESVYTLHAVSKDVVKECNVTGDPLQWHVVDAGIWAEAIRERKTLFVNNYSEPHPRKRGLPLGHPYVERFMVVPILEGERIVALAGVGNKASAYDKSDERQIVLLLSGMWGYVQKNLSKEELQKAYDELEKSNAELGKYNRQLEALNKELQDFAFVASHDLQEPLRKVRTFGDMLLSKGGVFSDEASTDYLRRMQTAVARMQNLLNSLLAYSRLTTRAEPLKRTDLGKSAEAALSNLEIMIKEKNAQVEVGDLPTVRADRVQMVQLFQNLIGNALKFSRVGEAPHVKIYAREGRDANGVYEICVEDKGIGFEERYLDKIFLPFQRLHGRTSDYDGVGMGLAICKKIVERHGGAITARSELGKGSTFIVTLPAEKKM
jgi:PAS domain S-box-containing protein